MQDDSGNDERWSCVDREAAFWPGKQKPQQIFYVFARIFAKTGQGEASEAHNGIVRNCQNMVKLQRAQGECLGTGSRRRTRLTAISHGEL